MADFYLKRILFVEAGYDARIKKCFDIMSAAQSKLNIIVVDEQTHNPQSYFDNSENIEKVLRDNFNELRWCIDRANRERVNTIVVNNSPISFWKCSTLAVPSPQYEIRRVLEWWNEMIAFCIACRCRINQIYIRNLSEESEALLQAKIYLEMIVRHELHIEVADMHPTHTEDDVIELILKSLDKNKPDMRP